MNQSLDGNKHNIFKDIGCIIEKPDFYTYLTAKKNLELLAMISKSDQALSNIQKCIDLVGLTGREKDKVKTFSHGMKQRLGIAQCLIHDPEIIILDEPTTGLDPEGIIEFRQLIIRLRDEFKKTILLSSHILSEIELVADHIIIINKGKLISQGNIMQLLNEEDMIIHLEVDDVSRCKAIIQETFGIIVNPDDLFIQFKLNKNNSINY